MPSPPTAPHMKCLTVIWAVMLLSNNLKFAGVKIWIDNDALHWISNLAHACWRPGHRHLWQSAFGLMWGIERSLSINLQKHFWGRQTDGQDETNLNDALAVFTVMPAEWTNNARCGGEEWHVMVENFKATAIGHPGVPERMTASNVPSETLTAEPLIEQMLDPLCDHSHRQLKHWALTIRTTAADSNSAIPRPMERYRKLSCDRSNSVSYTRVTIFDQLNTQWNAPCTTACDA